MSELKGAAETKEITELREEEGEAQTVSHRSRAQVADRTLLGAPDIQQPLCVSKFEALPHAGH